MERITLKLNGLLTGVSFKTFTGGEEQVNIDMSTIPRGSIGNVEILAKLKSSTDVMRMFALANAVKLLPRLDKNCVFTLDIPYLPYARQDRQMNPGEAHTLKMFGNMVNALGFDHVIVDDPHSDVAQAVIDNIQIRTQDRLFAKYWCEQRFRSDVAIIAPDAGARKKAQLVADLIKAPLIVAGKKRDLNTNGISDSEVYGSVQGLNCLIVDDICDGGRTFMSLAGVLKEKGATSVMLYVTHGIFSYGKNDIYDSGVDSIHAYHDWCSNF